MKSLQQLFRNSGFNVKYQLNSEFEENRLDKTSHASRTKVYKGYVNRLGLANLQTSGEKIVAIKAFCRNNRSIEGTYPANFKNFINQLREEVTQSAEELIYERDVYIKVSKIPELANNIIKYVTFETIPLDPDQYKKYVFSNPNNPYKEEYKNTLETNFQDLSDLYMPEGLPPYENSVAKRYFKPDFFYLHMLVTEYTPGQSLYSVIKNTPKPFTEDFILPILFQIIWGIQMLQKYGIEHNDMHENNVFVVLDTPKTMNRQHTTNAGDIFTMPSGSPRILFFDWDFANMTTQHGPKASDPKVCERTGICGVLNERRDIYRALMQFIFYQRSFMPQSVKDFLDVILQGPVGKQKLDFRRERGKDGKLGSIDDSYPCNADPSQPDKCRPYDMDEPQEIRDSAFLLKQRCFQRYKLGFNAVSMVSNFYHGLRKKFIDTTDIM